MAGRFEATVVIDRPIEEVFAFLADCVGLRRGDHFTGAVPVAAGYLASDVAGQP
jgi:hypothetical protein